MVSMCEPSSIHIVIGIHKTRTTNCSTGARVCVHSVQQFLLAIVVPVPVFRFYVDARVPGSPNFVDLLQANREY